MYALRLGDDEHISRKSTRSTGIEDATMVTLGSAWAQMKSSDRRSADGQMRTVTRMVRGLTGNVVVFCKRGNLDDFNNAYKARDDTQAHGHRNANLFVPLHVQVPDDVPGQ